jgi:hypothetical protein
MNTNLTSRPTNVPPTRADDPARPGRGRRAAVAVTGFLTCALPVMFTVNVSRMLLTGVDPEHRFHQATGQGLLLFVLWLGALVPLVRAAWAGRRPTTGAAYRHLTFGAAGAVCAALAPGGGAPILVGVIVVTGALLWWALPVRPRLRGRLQVDPLLAPFALALGAVLLPYAADQVAAQNATTSPYHLENPHLFDMAWLAVTLVVLALLAAFLPAVRSLARWAAGCTLGLGVAGLSFGADTTWSFLVLALGLLGSGLVVLQRRLSR